MKKNGDGRYTYSPSDLNSFLENECITWLDRFNCDFPNRIQKDEPSEEDRLIQTTGIEHEERFLKTLRDEGGLVTIDPEEKSAFQRTAAAMRDGAPVIYQARLERGDFAGWADFLFRVDGDSELGAWHYQVWDTKLALAMKPYFAIQLCCYAEMLEVLQGRLPERAGIILGNNERRSLRLSSYWFYFQSVKRDFLQQQRSFCPDKPPHFSGMADYRHWNGHVQRLLESRDDVSRTANIRTAQVEKLNEAGIATMHALASTTRKGVPRMAQPTFERLRHQARLQRASKAGEPPVFEILPEDSGDPRKGFGMLPPASPNDVCFDIEGYPLMQDGLEYLLGVTCREKGRLTFKSWWAHDRAQERASFESFIDWVFKRWQQDPSMHVYHYAAYETTALKKLMCRYASREAEVDALLRNEVFVDLYTVVRQSLLIGEPAYSLKNVEHLYMPARSGEVATAAGSVVYYHRWLTSGDQAILDLIRDYNMEDCDSTWKLAEWLRARQQSAGRAYVKPDPPRELKDDTNARSELAQRMLKEIPQDRSADPERWRVHELLAYLLEFHRREHKSLYWAMFKRAEMIEQELIDDQECLGGLQRTKRPPQPDKQSFVYEYRFPEQETKLHAESKCLIATELNTHITIESMDEEGRTLTIRRGKKNGPLPGHLSLIPDEIVGAKPIVESIERTVRDYLSTGHLPRALDDFLHRRRPRIAGQSGGPIIPEGADLNAASLRAVLGLDSSTLCIQGPPGSGKTTRAGRIIAQLLKAGRRIGISSNGHEAVCVLMKAAAEAATAMGIQFSAAKVGENGAREKFHPAIEIIDQNKALFALPHLPDLVGGSYWVFSLPEARDEFDYLFIDEAGQVSIANLMGIAPAADNLVVLGDQMQLSQPIQGVHPGESGQSILEYYLQDHATVPEDLGIFLPTTFRMRPELCSFISEAIYEGRLKNEKSTESRSLQPFSAGIQFVPVAHEGNIYESEEEAAAIRDIIGDLLTREFLVDGQPPRRLTEADILVVAPYNLQVRKLRHALPQGVRVGTVDKFQGQQAPVVIFSMTSSEGDASPHGIEFLFDSHRLNVAISRAQVLAVLVASPKLTLTRCSNLDQMELVNLLCRATWQGTVFKSGI